MFGPLSAFVLFLPVWGVGPEDTLACRDIVTFEGGFQGTLSHSLTMQVEPSWNKYIFFKKPTRFPGSSDAPTGRDVATPRGQAEERMLGCGKLGRDLVMPRLQPGLSPLLQQSISRAVRRARPQKMPERGANLGGLGEKLALNPDHSGQVLVGTLSADQQL